MSLNPIGIVIALIAGLVVAFVTLWNKSDSFREFWINLWEKIKTVCSNAINAIGKFFTETLPAFIDKAIEFIKQLPTKIWTWLVNTIIKVEQWKIQMWQKAGEMALGFINKVIEFVRQLPEKIWTWLLNVVTKVVQWGTDLGNKGREAGQKLMDKLIEKVSEIPNKMLSIGSDVVRGLWDGINNKVKWLKDKISDFVGDVTDWLKDKFGIHSPSKVMADEVGKWLPEGIAVGISKNAKSVLGAMRDLTMDTVGSARAGLSTATTTLGGGSVGGVVNNFTQVINSPKQLSRLEIYRQSKNLLGYAGGGF
jgi:phage-related protein